MESEIRVKFAKEKGKKSGVKNVKERKWPKKKTKKKNEKEEYAKRTERQK